MSSGYTLGVLGGSGLYEMEGLSDVKEIDVDTPFGKPSDVLVRGTLPNGTAMIFVPRHGRGHRVPPHAINYRANVCALIRIWVIAGRISCWRPVAVQKLAEGRGRGSSSECAAWGCGCSQ